MRKSLEDINPNRSFSGVYKSGMKDNSSYINAVNLSNKFAKIDGRRPRILIAKIGQDGHDRGAKLATSFADIDLMWI